MEEEGSVEVVVVDSSSDKAMALLKSSSSSAPESPIAEGTREEEEVLKSEAVGGRKGERERGGREGRARAHLCWSRRTHRSERPLLWRERAWIRRREESGVHHPMLYPVENG